VDKIYDHSTLVAIKLTAKRYYLIFLTLSIFLLYREITVVSHKILHYLGLQNTNNIIKLTIILNMNRPNIVKYLGRGLLRISTVWRYARYEEIVLNSELGAYK